MPGDLTLNTSIGVTADWPIMKKKAEAEVMAGGRRDIQEDSVGYINRQL